MLKYIASVQRHDAAMNDSSSLAKVSQKVREFRLREQTILSCAERLFIEQGEDRVTVEMIADEVGIGKGTIYKHFETKNEIYLLLMLRYEEALSDLFRSLKGNDDPEALFREFLRFRVQDPDRYLLFDRLEGKLAADKILPDLLEKLHSLRASNRGYLSEFVVSRIAEGKLMDAPVEYHIGAAWALAHGACSLIKSDFYTRYIGEPEKFIDFLLDIGVRMANRRGR